jgi:hypothetical protein
VQRHQCGEARGDHQPGHQPSTEGSHGLGGKDRLLHLWDPAATIAPQFRREQQMDCCFQPQRADSAPVSPIYARSLLTRWRLRGRNVTTSTASGIASLKLNRASSSPIHAPRSPFQRRLREVELYNCVSRISAHSPGLRRKLEENASSSAPPLLTTATVARRRPSDIAGLLQTS